MNTEEKINELLNEYPINKAILTEDELSAYHQGLQCGAYNMGEWKDEQFKEEKKQWIEKAVEYLIFNTHDYYDGDSEFAVCNWLKRDEFIEKFKQVMNEE